MNEPLLTLQQIHLELPSTAKAILHDINYHVFPEDFIILLGSNGSGKSSLLKLIDRRYQQTKGKIILHGKQKIITLTQNSSDSLFTNLSILENCLLLLKKKADFFAEYLHEFNNNLSTKLDTKVAKLSGGEQQALVLALSVLQSPSILLLDEHTSALDPHAAKRLMEITAKVISDKKITCILCTHNLDIALNYGNRILALQNGKIHKQIDTETKSKTKRTMLLGLY